MDAQLVVTFVNGEPYVGYFHPAQVRRETVARSRRCGSGLVADLAEDGRVLGIEITAPSLVDLETFNRVLGTLGLEPVDERVLAPLHAA